MLGPWCSCCLCSTVGRRSQCTLAQVGTGCNLGSSSESSGPACWHRRRLACNPCKSAWIPGQCDRTGRDARGSRGSMIRHGPIGTMRSRRQNWCTQDWLKTTYVACSFFTVGFTFLEAHGIAMPAGKSWWTVVGLGGGASGRGSAVWWSTGGGTCTSCSWGSSIVV